MFSNVDSLKHYEYTKSSRTRVRLFIAALLIISSLGFVGAGDDDASIMLFAGETLGKGPWFLNHNGVPQEISTSVLGALLAGFASVLAPPGFEFAYWKIFAWLPAIAAGMVFFEILQQVCSRRYGVYGALVLCCFPNWHYWAWGGLESGLFCLVTLLFLCCLARFSSLPGNSAALAAALFAIILPLVRADALWAPLLLLGSGISIKGISAWNKFWPGILACAVVFAFHCLRYHFTGQWLPNPAYAKAPFSLDSLRYGFDYLYQFHSDTPLHTVLALSLPISLFGTFRLFRSDSESTCFQARLFAWACTLVLVNDLTTLVAGGDWMSYHRFAARNLPLKLIVIALGINILEKSGVFARIRPSLRKSAGISFCLLGLSGWTAQGIVERPGYYRYPTAIINSAKLDKWPGITQYMVESNIPFYRDNSLLLPWINKELPSIVGSAKRQEQTPVIIASYQAGLFPRELRKRYDTNEIFFIDLAGLSDSRIGRLPGAKTPLGLKDGTLDWAQSIAKNLGALGSFLKDCRPDIVYVVNTNTDEIKLMQDAGFELIYNKSIKINNTFHWAIIFKSLAHGTKRCAGLIPTGR